MRKYTPKLIKELEEIYTMANPEIREHINSRIMEILSEVNVGCIIVYNPRR